MKREGENEDGRRDRWRKDSCRKGGKEQERESGRKGGRVKEGGRGRQHEGEIHHSLTLFLSSLEGVAAAHSSG